MYNQKIKTMRNRNQRRITNIWGVDILDSKDSNDPKSVYYKGNSETAKILGGEVTNETNVSWLISGGSNSNENDFNWLPPNTNSDNWEWVNKQLSGDVDAVWPAGQKIKDYNTGKIVTSGAFKLRDHRNTNIIKENGEYVIYDFSIYYSDNQLPQGWRLPSKYKK